ncbi:hypothetical protein F511_46186 [Dorcoceras hygrometricum]|uniref:Uncharacterized protein n=1 Tax=Dorcoceras hygrometricum TaxID=472368 RepID=A0A2Z6ZUM5_9LAMI|nr:hypothetical protein F511_46186 [Dorcoceras hygrometricum]
MCGGNPLRARAIVRAHSRAGQHALSRGGRPPCANVAHRGALVVPSMARPSRARRGKRAAECRTQYGGGRRRRSACFP